MTASSIWTIEFQDQKLELRRRLFASINLKQEVNTRLFETGFKKSDLLRSTVAPIIPKPPENPYRDYALPVTNRTMTTTIEADRDTQTTTTTVYAYKVPTYWKE